MAKRPPTKGDLKFLGDFESARSHEGSKIAYDLCKVTAQSCLLMNGGAATAVLAFLAKDEVDPTLYQAIPSALAGYGLGVAASALMLFSVMMNADYWNYYWYNLSYEEDEFTANQYETVANRWMKVIYAFFAISTICFVSASLFLACSLSRVISMPTN
jgi:hypothetical protein